MREKQPHLTWIVEELPPETHELIYCRTKAQKRFYHCLPIYSHTTSFFKIDFL